MFIQITEMTELGGILVRKSINKAEVSRRTGISQSQFRELSLNPSARLRADITLAIDIESGDVFNELHSDLELEENGNYEINY